MRDAVDRSESTATSSHAIKDTESVADLQGKVELGLESLRLRVENQGVDIPKSDAEAEILAACADDPHFVDEVDVVVKIVKEDASGEIPKGKVGLAKTKFARADLATSDSA